MLKDVTEVVRRNLEKEASMTVKCGIKYQAWSCRGCRQEFECAKQAKLEHLLEDIAKAIKEGKNVHADK